MSRELMSDIQVTVHKVEGATSETVGFGVTGAEGAFQLMTNGAQGPLWLTPGEYRFTLESAGAPVPIPKQYGQAASTSLKVTWPTSNEAIDLSI